MGTSHEASYDIAINTHFTHVIIYGELRKNCMMSIVVTCTYSYIIAMLDFTVHVACRVMHEVVILGVKGCNSGPE